MCLYNWFVIESHDNLCFFPILINDDMNTFRICYLKCTLWNNISFFLISFHHGFDIDIVTVDRGEWHIFQIVLYMIKLLLRYMLPVFFRESLHAHTTIKGSLPYNEKNNFLNSNFIFNFVSTYFNHVNYVWIPLKYYNK
jgi:hypothetical protein